MRALTQQGSTVVIDIIFSGQNRIDLYSRI